MPDHCCACHPPGVFCSGCDVNSFAEPSEHAARRIKGRSD
jgi:hypothetical protein